MLTFQRVQASLTSEPLVRGPRWYSHGYNRAEVYRLAAALGWLPRPTRLALARALGRVAPRFMPAERAVIRTTLARVTGVTGSRLDALTLATFSDFAMCFSDLVSTNREPPARLTSRVGRTEGAEHVTRLDGGFISVTAHVGNWELAGRLLTGRTARTTHVVVAEEGLHLERWVRRDADGVRFVTRACPTISVQLIAALRRGDVVALQGDRALGTRGDVLIPFFGRPAPFPRGPFLLARAVGVPVVPAFCLLEESGQYAVVVAEPMVVARDREEDAARAWVALLEDVVRRHPTQWFNFFDIWNPLLA
jgi:lauroyl/myristoyl acyltransferase